MQNKRNNILNKLKTQSASTVDALQLEQVKQFPSTANGKIISMDEFSMIDSEDLEIFVVRPVKKIVSVLSHTLKQKFQNLKFPEIPSKTQILKKEQTRIKYYNDLFYHFKRYAIEYPNLKTRLLKVVYILLIMDSQYIKQCTHERLEMGSSVPNKDQALINSGRYGSQIGSARTDSRQDTGFFQITDPNEDENDIQREQDFELFLGYMEDNTIIADRGRFGASEITERPSKVQIDQLRQPYLQERRKTRRGSINQDEIDKVKNIDLLEKSKTSRELDLNPGLYYKMHQDMKQLHNKDVHLGYCWVKFPLNNSWQRLFARVQDSCIKFCKDVQVNEFLTSYVIYNCLIDTMKIKIAEWDNKIHQAMIIRHEFDSEWLLIAVEDEKMFYQKRQELLAKSLEHSKNTMDIINETNRYSFGKIKIRIKHLCDVPNIGKLFVRLKLGPFIMETRRLKAPTQNSYKFSQDFIVPITNRFDQICIEIISYVTSGLFQGNHKETVIKEMYIPLPFLKEKQFTKDKISYSFPVDDFKKGKLIEQINHTSDNFFNMLGLQSQAAPSTEKIIQPRFEIQIKDLSQFTAMVMFNPNRDIVENRPKKKEYSRKEINLTISKLVLTIYKISDIENIERMIFYFKYPNLSKFLRVVLVFFLIYFDPQYLISYLLGIVIFVFILQNENWHNYTLPVLNYLFFSTKNDFINEEKGRKIITFRQDSIKKNMRTLLQVSNDIEPDKQKNKKKKQPNQSNNYKCTVDEDYMETAVNENESQNKEEKYERRQFGILEKYRDLKDKLAVLVFFFDMTTDFIEKFNKLLIWQDQKASKIFLVILIIIFFVISFLPLRYFIILAILKKFNRGSSYYKRRYTGNKEAIKIELRNFLLTNGHLKYEDLKKYGESYWMNKVWPNKRGFEKSLMNYLQDKLYILIPKGFQQEFKTPNDLIECAGFIDQVLVLRPRDENEWELRNNKNLFRKSPNPLVYLYNFIMNNIASMIYLHKNKKYLKIDNSC